MKYQYFFIGGGAQSVEGGSIAVYYRRQFCKAGMCVWFLAHVGATWERV